MTFRLISGKNYLQLAEKYFTLSQESLPGIVDFSDVIFEGRGGCAPNAFDIARKFIKKSVMLQESWSQFFRDFILVKVGGQTVKKPPPQWKVSRHISGLYSAETISFQLFLLNETKSTIFPAKY